MRKTGNWKCVFHRGNKGGGIHHIKSGYRLMIGNLMNLTHETRIHAPSIGQRAIDETP